MIKVHPIYTRYGIDEDLVVWFIPKKRRVNPVKGSLGYLVFNAGRTQQYYHRFIVECLLGKKLDKNQVIDHIDEVKTNNSLTNLRILPRIVNLMQRKKSVGVYRDKARNKWRVCITIPGSNKMKFIGRYVKKSDAIKAYDNAKKKYQEGLWSVPSVASLIT